MIRLARTMAMDTKHLENKAKHLENKGEKEERGRDKGI